MDLIQIKIKDDKNKLQYISIIRKYDSTLSIKKIKTNIENNNFVVSFDLDYHDAMEEQYKVNYKTKFRYLIDDLITAGTKIDIFQNDEGIFMGISPLLFRLYLEIPIFDAFLQI